MAITDKNTLKSWFKRGLKPLESQFHAWMDSYWHKSEKLATSDIKDLENILNQKAEAIAQDQLSIDLSRHEQDQDRHKTEDDRRKLNNLADDANAAYVTREEIAELETSSAIVIPVDFTKDTLDEALQEAKDLVTPLFADGTIHSKPLYLLYIWKEDYVAEDAPVYQELVYLTRKECTTTGVNARYDFYFYTPIAVLCKEDPAWRMEGECIVIKKVASRISVDFVAYQDDLAPEVIPLYEDGNYLISLLDQDPDHTDVNYRQWSILYDELKKGKHPALLLKTPDSGMYCPASYDFTTAPTCTGSIQISYVRETDGVQELWVETRNFSGFSGSNGYYSSPYLKKYPLGDSMRVSRIQVVDSLPTTGLQDGDIIILRQV